MPSELALLPRCAAQVYKGLMDGVNDVAIKLLKPETKDSAASIEKFIAEIDVLRACRDQHIVGFMGAWANQVRYSTLYSGSLESVPRGTHACCQLWTA